MDLLSIDSRSHKTVKASFDKIAHLLFNELVLQVNHALYRFVDIEFYYYNERTHKDVYAHLHEAQLKYGKWYFHGSGIDITIGDGINYGGILLRGIVKLQEESFGIKHSFEKEIHGPLKVKTEVCSHLFGVFEGKGNHLQLKNIKDLQLSDYLIADKIIHTQRIGLNPIKDDAGQDFYGGKFRYVIFPHLKLRNKSQIARDMQEQFTDLTIPEINKALGSTFLK